MVPIHFDTFVNSIDEPGDALRELEKAQKSLYVGPGRTVTPLAIGERRTFIKIGEGPPVPKPKLTTGVPTVPTNDEDTNDAKAKDDDD